MQAGVAVPRGTTLRGPTATITASVYGESVNYEGQIAQFPAQKAASTKGVIADLLARKTQTMAFARNTVGSSVTGKTGVTWEAGYEFKRFDSKSSTAGSRCDGVVDDMLTTCRDDDMCWVHIGGPAYVQNDNSGTDIAVGDLVVAGATAGYFDKCQTTFTTTELTDGTLFKMLTNNIGRAMEAETGTTTDVLVDLTIYPSA